MNMAGPIRCVGWRPCRGACGDIAAVRPFIVHACEGVDERAREELWELDRLGLLDANAVLVHGLAIDHKGLALMKERGAALSSLSIF